MAGRQASKTIDSDKRVKQSDYDIGPKQYDFHTDLRYGKQGEKLVEEFLQTLSGGAFEVKTDRYRNGRMVLEMEHNPRRETDEEGKPKWKPSGLAVTKARWWVYVYTLDGSFIIVDVQRIKRYLKANKDRFNPKKYNNFAQRSSNPSRGYLLQPEDVMDLMINPAYDTVPNIL
jgi:hypothetical protein